MVMAVGPLVQAIKGTVLRIDLICELEYLCKRATQQVTFIKPKLHSLFTCESVCIKGMEKSPGKINLPSMHIL